MFSRLPKDRTLEREDMKNIAHLLQAQQILALLDAKVAGRSGTGSSQHHRPAQPPRCEVAVASIAKDGLLVVPQNDPLQPSSELVIVLRSVLDGLVIALHLRLDDPSKSQ